MKLHNTLTRQKDQLTPLNDSTVKMYTCGLTVYSQPHIGNWVSYVYWDVLERTLRALGYEVHRVQNITDVGHLVSDDDTGEDKMEKGARAEGSTAWEIADKYIAIADREAYTQLGLLKPELVRATECIDAQIDFVRQLEEMGFTYTTDDGVYFDTTKLSDYGKLAQLDVHGLEAGARVAVGGKKNITDFALWKHSPEGKKRDMEWGSPWGVGFPGWHLECSVIAREGLGDQIDIHTGGIDHIPVHHTNEIAQTESLTGKPFSQFWVHNNHLKVDGGKMAKSEGRAYTLQDITDRGFSVQAYKLMLLSKHYRTEGNFTWDILGASQSRLNGFQRMAALVWQADVDAATPGDNYFNAKQQAILDALADDLNTPLVVSILSEIQSDIERFGLHNKHVKDMHALLDFISNVLGLDLHVDDITDQQRKLLKQRQQARQDKNWNEADKLRDTLSKQGISLEDTAQSQVWYRL